jgi:putative membrane fusion protein
LRTFYKIIAGMLIVFVLWNAYLLIARQHETEMAMHGVIENSISAKGYLIKSETVINASASGMLKAYCEEGEKVARGQRVVSVVDHEIDEAAQTELASINKRITEIKANSVFSDDLLNLDEQINKINKQIISYAAAGKVGKISSLKNELLVLIDKKAAVKGENSSELLSSLNKRKNELESRAGGTGHDMYAPCSGIYSAQIDGLETQLTPANMENLTVKDLEEITGEAHTPPEKISVGDAAYKIIDNFSFYVAVIMDDKDTEDLKPQSYVSLRISEAPSGSIKALVYYISEEEGGKRVAVFKPSREVEGITQKRYLSVDVIKNRYEGFKLPVSALSVENKVTGVYVDEGGEVVFKKADVLYKSDESMIIKEDNSAENYLLLYDNVILKGNGGF